MGRTHHLRVLIANQRADRLDLLAEVVIGLGHEVIAREIHVSEVGAVTARERPDVALVGLGESSDHALRLITEIVRGAFCPVIALLEAYDAEWVDQAAQHGVYAYIVDSRPEELQSAIDITLRRFAEFQDVQGAFKRRNAELLRETELTLARRRQLLELHDGVGARGSRSRTSLSSSTGPTSRARPCWTPSKTPAHLSAAPWTTCAARACRSSNCSGTPRRSTR